MLPKKTKYAIKALIALAENYDSGPTHIYTIAEEKNISQKFLEAILVELRRYGIVGSKKGRNGGYYLLKDPAEISLAQIFRFTNGPIALVSCVSQNFYEPCEDCLDEATCGMHNVAIEVRDAVLRTLSESSIADLLARQNRLKQLHWDLQHMDT